MISRAMQQPENEYSPLLRIVVKQPMKTDPGGKSSYANERKPGVFGTSNVSSGLAVSLLRPLQIEHLHSSFHILFATFLYHRVE